MLESVCGSGGGVAEGTGRLADALEHGVGNGRRRVGRLLEERERGALVGGVARVEGRVDRRRVQHKDVDAVLCKINK